MTNGILLVDKPRGWTSFDVVNYIRKIVAAYEGKKQKSIKVGHTGTLDPLATGLLVLLIGDYTKRAPVLSKLDKTYEVTMRLGETSTTGDGEGDISQGSSRQPRQDELNHALAKYTGLISQTPPAYSAVKVAGQRAYKLARAGKPVEIEPRTVTIYEIGQVKYDYPLVSFTTRVASGTYVRALVEDIGAELGVGAYMSDLIRTSVGDYRLADAVDARHLDAQAINARLRSA